MTTPPGPEIPPPHQGGFYSAGHHPQRPWPETPPPKTRGGVKWMLGAVALLAVVGVTVAVTLAVTGKDKRDAIPPGSGVSGSPTASDIASADDSGPVSVITEDPTCAAQGPILETFAAQQSQLWVERDPALGRESWSPELRADYEKVGKAMRTAADQVAQLAKITPHRAMRELYEQFIAYARAYADNIPNYTPPTDNLARVAVTAADAISYICAAVSYGSAAARAPLVENRPAPTNVAPLGNPSEPERFLTAPNPVCGEWSSVLNAFQTDTTEWLKTDPDISSSQWSIEQKQINENVIPIMKRFANQLYLLGKDSGNPTFRDIADLSVQYRLAYVAAIPTYTPADKYLANASIRLATMANVACRAAAD
ncbi:hypothetical protein D806_000760 [Mycolicibacterium smegmatis MKD8]|nr:hypothetical protein D806_000760 [Mycolicibacterium smegmatis MKD8]